jgi:hypothetical protein
MLEVVRNADGTVRSGVLSPGGRGGNPLAKMERRLYAELAREAVERKTWPKVAERMLECLENPDSTDPLAALFVRETLARVAPVVAKHELSGTDGGPVEIASRDQWARLADGFGEEIPAGSELVVEQSHAPTKPGAD